MAAIESGAREAYVSTVSRLVESAGGRLSVLPTRTAAVADVAVEVARLLANDGARVAYRVVRWLHDDLVREEPASRVALCALRPPRLETAALMGCWRRWWSMTLSVTGSRSRCGQRLPVATPESPDRDHPQPAWHVMIGRNEVFVEVGTASFVLAMKLHAWSPQASTSFLHRWCQHDHRWSSFAARCPDRRSYRHARRLVSFPSERSANRFSPSGS